ncbi:hypothetical protein BHM03_00026960, partial [Ensete ventricosum]
TVDQFSGESRPVVLPLDGKQFFVFSGKRRALIPPDVGYVNENLKPIPDEKTLFLRCKSLFFNNHTYFMLQFGPRRSLLSHANEPLVFEVQLLKVL